MIQVSSLVAVVIFAIQQGITDRLPRAPVLTRIDKMATVSVVVVVTASPLLDSNQPSSTTYQQSQQQDEINLIKEQIDSGQLHYQGPPPQVMEVLPPFQQQMIGVKQQKARSKKQKAKRKERKKVKNPKQESKKGKK